MSRFDDVGVGDGRWDETLLDLKIRSMLKIPKQYEALKLISSIFWSSIFDDWRRMEASQPSWKEHWEKRGFSSWDEWRNDYIGPFRPASLTWFLYKIKDPVNVLPLFYGVPSKTWIRMAYEGETTKQLKEILEAPVVCENPKIFGIGKNFPRKTMLTGVLHEDRIVLVEGMHRACVLAGWGKNKPFEGEVLIALALWNEKDLPVIGGNQKNK